MDSRVGTVLREARNRRKIDLSEVEARTKIRIRYLRAIENEEWDVLPGGVYARGFIRTYGSFLGLDGERLAEDYRSTVEPPGDERGRPPDPVATSSSSSAPARGRRSFPHAGWAAFAAVILVAALVVIALPGGGGGTSVQRPSRSDKGRGTAGNGQAATARSTRPGVSMRLDASAEVWVCVLDAAGRHLVDGQILQPGATEGPFRSGSFTVSFGNGEVSMLIDGKRADIAATSSPIGYAIDSAGRLTELSEGQRPTCA